MELAVKNVLFVLSVSRN